jgi:hypothetical protein
MSEYLLPELSDIITDYEGKRLVDAYHGYHYHGHDCTRVEKFCSDCVGTKHFEKQLFDYSFQQQKLKTVSLE